MCKAIAVDSRAFEILLSETSKGLADIVNDAIEKGYEPLWGSVVQENHSPTIQEMVYSYELGANLPIKVTKINNHYLQAVTLKDKAKFDAWASEQKRIAEEMDARKEEEYKIEKGRRDVQNYLMRELDRGYRGKTLTYTPKRLKIKGGLVTIRDCSVNTPANRISFIVQRLSNHGFIQNVEPSELGLDLSSEPSELPEALQSEPISLLDRYRPAVLAMLVERKKDV
jgi:hypothetical protein